jgi:hypothetical protein
VFLEAHGDHYYFPYTTDRRIAKLGTDRSGMQVEDAGWLLLIASVMEDSDTEVFLSWRSELACPFN